MRRALYGVKQMKEVMWRNEQKHEHLMKSLRHSSDKKKVGVTLTFPLTEKGANRGQNMLSVPPSATRGQLNWQRR